MNRPRAEFRYFDESYYGRPAVKSSVYGWRVALYTFLGGLAGAAQVIAALADVLRRRRSRDIVRNGRYIAAAIGAGIGPALLIADLHTPNRWYNMLRIFRRTSSMSIGSYILTGFGASSALAAGAHYFAARANDETSAQIARAAQFPAALTGAGMATYTPALLAATATPLWASTPRLLATEFATAAFASGAAALSLAERATGTGDTRALDRIACTATAAHAAASFAAAREHKRQGVDRALKNGKWAAVHKIGVALSVGVPLVCYALDALYKQPSARRSALASAGILTGTFLSRWALFEAGNESAGSPEQYLHFASGEPHAASENTPWTKHAST